MRLWWCAVVASTAACNAILGIGDPTLDPGGGGAGGVAVGGATGGEGGSLGGGGIGGAGGGGAPPACPDCTGDVLWSLGMGSSGNALGSALVVIGDSVVVAGQASGDIDLGGGTTSPSGDARSIVVARYDARGANVWQQRFGGARQELVTAMAALPGGDVIIAGYFDDTIDLGAGLSAASSGQNDEDGFVAALDGSSGAPLWLLSFGGADDQRIEDVAVNGQGRVYALGWSRNMVAGDEDVTLYAIDAGAVSDSLTIATPASEWGRAVALDAAGNVYLAGDYSGTFDIDGLSLPNDNNGDCWIARLDPALSAQWLRGFGGNNDQRIRRMSYDLTSDRLVVTGGLSSELVYQGDVTPALYAGQQWLAVFDADGTLLWRELLGEVSASDDDERVLIPAFDGGILTLSGWFEGNADYGDGAIVSDGRDAFSAKLAPGGVRYWSHHYAAADDQYTSDVKLAADGSAYVTGSFGGSISLAADHSCPANECMFVAKLAR